MAQELRAFRRSIALTIIGGIDMFGKLLPVALAAITLPQSCTQIDAASLTELGSPVFTVTDLILDNPLGGKIQSLERLMKEDDPPVPPIGGQDPPTA